MKTKLMLMLAVVLLCASCGKDDESSATVYYGGLCSSITFSNSAHEVYREKISSALETMQMVGTGSYFAQSASAKSVEDAAAQCDASAQNTYQARLQNLTLLALKQQVFRMYQEEFEAAGIHSFSELSFDGITLTLRLVNTRTALVVKEYVVSL